MLKFTAVQLVDNEDVIGMILVICQTKILQCFELYANIERIQFPPQTLNQYLINHNIIDAT